jgi:hypothetical protein
MKMKFEQTMGREVKDFIFVVNPRYEKEKI